MTNPDLVDALLDLDDRLHGYQLRAVRHLWEHSRAALFLEMGLGKTAIVLSALTPDHLPALVVGPKRVAEHVWAKETAKWRPDLSVAVAAGTAAERKAALAAGADITTIGVANIANVRPLFKTVILDECVPAGTAIATPSGSRAIETLAEGDLVLGVDHRSGRIVPSRVRRTMTHVEYRPLTQVNGVRMTEGHPVWTPQGYVPAGRINIFNKVGVHVVKSSYGDGDEGLRVVRARVRGGCSRDSEGPTILRDIVLSKVADAATQGPGEDGQGLVRPRAAGKDGSSSSDPRGPGTTTSPDARPRCSRDYAREGVGEPRSTRESIDRQSVGGVETPERGKWARGILARDPRGGMPGVADEPSGICGGRRASLPLRDRRGERNVEDWGGTGRPFAQWCEAAGIRSEEGSPVGVARVDDPPVPELRSGAQPPEDACTSGGERVYNIETDTENYFAGGLLVHNCSLFKDPSTKRWQTAKAVTRFVDNVWELTGTPTPNGLINLWAQIYLLDHGKRLGGGKRYGTGITAFRDKWFVKGFNGFTYEPRDGAEGEILSRIADICVSMRAEDYLELPPVTYNTIELSMPPEAVDAYESMRDELFAEIGEEDVLAANAAVKLGKLAQITAGFLYDEDHTVHRLHDEKVRALQEIVDGTGTPILVFYRFTAELAALQAAFPDARQIKDPGVIDAWNSGEVDMLLAHPASAGHGLNLQEGPGSTIVWTSLDWSSERWQQANARLIRQGQQRPVIVHTLEAGPVDREMADVVQGKITLQNAVMRTLRA